MNPDGISYLDLGDAFFHGDWKNAINGSWSPLFSWIVSAGLYVFKPSIYKEFQLAHWMQFLVYVAALISFHFFLIEILRWNQKKTSLKFLLFSDIFWLLLGYSLFLWASLKLITLISVTPDMVAISFLFLSSGMLLRILNGGISISNFFLLGILLGLGYLARAPFFPLAFIFLIVTFIGIRNIPKAVPLTLAALFSFLLISGPYLLALSNSKQRFTFSESGKLNYAWKINGVPRFVHWQGTPGYGKPKHPTRKIFDTPAIYEFGTPIGGTYPPWYDPSYWYEGVETHFDFKQQLSRIGINLKYYFEIFFQTGDKSGFQSIFKGDLFLGAYLILVLLSGRKRLILNDILQEYPMILPAIFGLGMYVLIWIEPRYVAGYFILLLLALFSSIRLPDTPENKRVSNIVAIVVSALVIIGVAASIILSSYVSFQDSMSGKSNFVYADVAQDLQKMGIQPGTKVSNIGYTFEAYWARLAHVKIVSEITDDDEKDFWNATPDLRKIVYEKIAETGASILVAYRPPKGTNLDDWSEIGQTDYYVYFLAKGNTIDDSKHQ